MSGTRLAFLGAAAVAVGFGAAAGAGLVLGNGAAPPARSVSDTSGEAPVAGAPVPRLAGIDPVSGEAVGLSDFRGRPLVVTVWASWCGQCRRQAGPIRRFTEAHRDTAVVGIDVQDDTAAARDFVAAAHWTHPSIADPDGRRAARLGVSELPTTYFFTRDHRLAATERGFASFDELEAALAQAKEAS